MCFPISQACAAVDDDAPKELILSSPLVISAGSRPKSQLPPLPPKQSTSQTLTRNISDTFSGLTPASRRSYTVVSDADAVRPESPLALLHPVDSPFPAVYERYKRYRLAVAASLADGDGRASADASSLLFAMGPCGAIDPPGLVEAMRAELDPGQRLIPLVALRLFLERSGLPVTKAHPACAAQVR